jgi:MscS family membrane protein
MRSFGLPALLLIAAAACAQTPAPAGRDLLGRDSPQSSIFHFLEACHSRDYAKAAYYLDMRHKAPADRAKEGPELARELEDLLDDTSFDIANLSRDPEGDQSDGLGSAFEHLATFHVDGQTLDLQMEHVELKAGLRVWLVSEAAVALIPEAHKVVAETAFEKRLPQQLVTFELLDTPVWRWIALLLMAAAIWYLAGGIAWGVVATVKPLAAVPSFSSPLRLALALAGFRAAMELAPPSSLPRLFIERALGLVFFLAIAWIGSVLIDLVAERWSSRLDPRVQAVSYSVLPLGRQVLKVALYLIAVLGVFSAWGYNTSTILAGLGVGGLAVALAAQKTLENLFGGISVIGDRPVLVGDVCRFGDRVGTVMHIGLRSTRLRTADRTVVSVPNGQIFFHPTLNLRRDTTSDQMAQVLSSIRQILAAETKVESGKIPVRFVGLGEYSLQVEVAVYVMTSDYDEFLAIQQDLLLKLLQAVENAGAALAVPLQESISK